MRTATVAALAGLVLLSGCASWPSEYQGVSVSEVSSRVNAIHSAGKGQWIHPSSCRTVTSGYKPPLAIPSTVDEAWKACLAQINQAENRLNAYVEKREAEHEARKESERLRHQKELEENGPWFTDLFITAKYESVDKANERLAKYGGKTRINSALMITGCSGRVCSVDYPPPTRGSGLRSSSLDILVTGIYTEPGRYLFGYKLVAFKSYGYGGMRTAVAVFRND